MVNIHEEVLAYLKQAEQEEKAINKKDNTIFIIDDIMNYAQNNKLKIVDNREKNGALWVYHDMCDTLHAIKLEHMGMNYKIGRGWWIK